MKSRLIHRKKHKPSTIEVSLLIGEANEIYESERQNNWPIGSSMDELWKQIEKQLMTYDNCSTEESRRKDMGMCAKRNQG